MSELFSFSKGRCNVHAESFVEWDDKVWSKKEGRTRTGMRTLPRHDLVREIAVLNKNKIRHRTRSD